MSYRDELDATRARADALERDLADARAELSEVKGESTALARRETGLPARIGDAALQRGAASGPAAQRWLGAPTRLEFEGVARGEVPESAYTELVEAIRRRVGEPGATTTLPGSLAWSSASPNPTGPLVAVYITARDGVTTIRVQDKLGPLASGIFGGIGGGVGGGGLFAPIMTVWISPVLLPIALSAWLGGVYYMCRRVYRGRSAARAEQLERLADELLEITEKRISESANDV